MLLLTIVTAVPLAPAATTMLADVGSVPITENALEMLAGAVIGSATITALVLLFFINALSKNRKVAYEIRDDFRRFASRHNREDDDRFDILVIRQWQIAMKIAKLEGQPMPVLETFPRRRYLDEEEGPGAKISDVRLAGIAPVPDSS